MLRIENSVLYFFLLILEVHLNLTTNVVYEGGKLFKALSKKDLKLILYERGDSILLYPIHILLLTEIHPFPKE